MMMKMMRMMRMMMMMMMRVRMIRMRMKRMMMMMRMKMRIMMMKEIMKMMMMMMMTGSRGLMDRALDLKPEVTQGCGFESRLWQEVHDCSSGAAHCSKCVHLDGLNAENTFHSSLYSVYHLSLICNCDEDEEDEEDDAVHDICTSLLLLTLVWEHIKHCNVSLKLRTITLDSTDFLLHVLHKSSPWELICIYPWCFATSQPIMLCNITANQNDFNTYNDMIQSCITSLFQHVKQKEKLNVNIKCDNLTFMKII